MKKFLTIITVLSIMISISYRSSAQELINIIDNPSFENSTGVGSSGPWIPWGSGVEISLTDMDAKTGNQSILSTTPGWGGPSRDITELLLTYKGGTYTFSINVKAVDSPAIVYFYLYLTGGDLVEDNRWLGGSMKDTNVTTDEWTTLSATTEIPDNILSAMIIVVNNSGGTRNLFIDDVSITKMGVYSAISSSSSSSSSASSSAIFTGSSIPSSSMVSSEILSSGAVSETSEDNSAISETVSVESSDSELDSADDSAEPSAGINSYSSDGVSESGEEGPGRNNVLTIVIAAILIIIASAVVFIFIKKRSGKKE